MRFSFCARLRTKNALEPFGPACADSATMNFDRVNCKETREPHVDKILRTLRCRTHYRYERRQPCTERLKIHRPAGWHQLTLPVSGRNSRPAFSVPFLKSKMPGIPTYGANGLRRRNHSLETLLYLESRKGCGP